MTLSESKIAHFSFASLVLGIAMTAVHHVFRLGPGLIAPGLMALVVAIALFVLSMRTGRNGFLIAYAIFAGLTVLWFGVFDGFLDHTLKAVGIGNVTFLPGSNAPVVATYFNFASQAATTAFYEWTGIATAALSVLVLAFTTLWLLRRFGADAVTFP